MTKHPIYAVWNYDHRSAAGPEGLFGTYWSHVEAREVMDLLEMKTYENATAKRIITMTIIRPQGYDDGA